MTTPKAVTPYESLLQLRAAYNDLVRTYRTSLDSDPPEGLLDQASEFVERGSETGALLDNPDERSEAQNMLNFWATLLYRYRRESGDEPPAAALLAFGTLPERPQVGMGPVPFQAPPLPPNLYVGRESFMADLRQQLKAGRNIALYSSPGMGKTSIATKLAYELRERFADGVLWARLGERPDLPNIFRDWGEALNIDDDEHDWFIDRELAGKLIRQALVRRQMLLVIDDAWQSDVAQALKLGGPHCAHIVTTYLMSVALDFDSQGAVPVPSLSPTEGLHLLAQGTSKKIEELQPVAEELIVTLGSSPLSFSLVANYFRANFSTGRYPDLKKLNLQLLVTKEIIETVRPSTPSKGTRDEVRTPASLLAAIAWSFKQLNEDEKYVLQAFESFPPKPNSFSDTAARYIAGERSHGIEKLLDYCLLERAGDGRYSLHRAVSDFLKYQRRERTDPTPEHRMTTFYVNLVRDALGQQNGLQVLEEEEKNILAALEAAYKREMWLFVIGGTNALFSYFDRRGLYEVAKENLNRARHAAEQLKDQESLASILLELGEMEERRSEYDNASEHLQASLDIATSLKKHDISARALQSLGVVAMAHGEYEDSERYLKQALVLASEIPDSYLICTIETRLGWMDRGVAEFAQSRTRTERALALARANGYNRQIAELELSMGVLDFLELKYPEAKAHDLEGLDYAKKAKDKRLQCALHQALGGVEIELGNFKDSETHLKKALHLSLEIGHRWYNGVIWKEVGELRLRQKLPNSAADAFKKGLDLARNVNSPELMGMSLYGLAHVAAAQENFAEARLQGQTSLNIFQSIGHYKTSEVCDWLRSMTESPSAT
jgi:tetratricopeptide (TPR) repeat protein